MTVKTNTTAYCRVVIYMLPILDHLVWIVRYFLGVSNMLSHDILYNTTHTTLTSQQILRYFPDSQSKSVGHRPRQPQVL